MIFVLNSKQVGKNKKLTKKIVKVLISDVFENGKDKNVIEMQQLLPPPKLFSKLIDEDISMKKFKKKYISNILDDPDKLSVVICIAIIAIQNNHVILTCSKQEMEYGYIEGIATILKEKYGFKISNKIDKESLTKKIKYDKKELLSDFEDVASLIASNKKEYKAIVNAILGKKAAGMIEKKKKKKDFEYDDYIDDENDDEYDDTPKKYESSVKVYRQMKVILSKKG